MFFPRIYFHQEFMAKVEFMDILVFSTKAYRIIINDNNNIVFFHLILIFILTYRHQSSTNYRNSIKNIDYMTAYYTHVTAIVRR